MSSNSHALADSPVFAHKGLDEVHRPVRLGKRHGVIRLDELSIAVCEHLARCICGGRGEPPPFADVLPQRVVLAKAVGETRLRQVERKSESTCLERYSGFIDANVSAAPSTHAAVVPRSINAADCEPMRG